MLGRLATFQRRLLTWYAGSQRLLPWRPLPGEPADPYHVLVSEAMLQQTQVATVIPYFQRFINRFSTLAELAAADEQELLRHWQGLGYYSRARNLHATSKILTAEHGGQVPSHVEQLLKLPGIGRYTAGAIASLAFGQRAPILDGNVARVLCRIYGWAADPRTPASRQQLWAWAEEILPRREIDQFNSALMELGALVCTPRQPRCADCPVRAHCQAMASGQQHQIPARAATRARPEERRWTLCIEHAGRWLIEQRPPTGRWAGLWQFPTLAPAPDSPADAARRLGLSVGRLQRLGELRHDLTHRRYLFEAHVGRARRSDLRPGQAWVTLGELDAYPLPRPQLQIAQWLAALAG